MGIASADLDADGYPEYFITSMADNKLRALDAPGPESTPRYADRAYKLGVTAHRPVLGGETKPSTAWHAQFGDLNNDGLDDLFVTKGNVDQMPEAAMRDHNNVLIRGAEGRFTDVTELSGAVSFKRGRGAAVVDLNLDGMLDLVVVNRRAGAELWRNLGAGTEHAPALMGRWLQVVLQQDGGNRNAIGAWIELRSGDQVQRREVTVGGGHAGGQLGWSHFGLGDANEAEIRVQWPDGTWSEWQPASANTFYSMHRDTERPKPIRPF